MPEDRKPAPERSSRKLGIIVTLILVAILVLVVLSSPGQGAVTCEVCITFGGRTQCRAASAAEREDAVRTATDNACTFLSAGMTESMRCSRTPPDSVSCTE